MMCCYQQLRITTNILHYMVIVVTMMYNILPPVIVILIHKSYTCHTSTSNNLRLVQYSRGYKYHGVFWQLHAIIV